jgi:hypothetical protein
MTHRIAVAPQAARIAGRVRATARKLSDRVPAAADDRVRDSWAGRADRTGSAP